MIQKSQLHSGHFKFNGWRIRIGIRKQNYLNGLSVSIYLPSILTMRRDGQKKKKDNVHLTKKQTARCRIKIKTVQFDISMEQVQGCSFHNINGKFISLLFHEYGYQ